MEGQNPIEPGTGIAQQFKCGSQTSTGSPFLALPLEIRKLIYRLLLCDDKPLSDIYCHIHLNPSILRTCRQVLTESRTVLYRENIWSMKIFDKSGAPRAYFLKCDHFGLDAEDTFGPRLKDLKQFEILVEIQSEYEVWNVKAAARAVCSVLSGVANLDYLHLKLDGRGFDAKRFPRVLESFALLRNVRKVVLDGVPPVYGQYFRGKMTGCSPLDHLPKMYEALEFYAGPFDCCENLLQEACAAMEDDDVLQFKHAREEIITVVTEHMTNAIDHLFDHDEARSL